MKNFKKAAFNVLSTTALLTTAAVPVAAVVAPAASFAAGTGSVSATTVPGVSTTGLITSPGQIKIAIPQYTAVSGSTVTLTLPQGLKFAGTGFGSSATNAVYAYDADTANGDTIGGTVLNDHQVQLTLTGTNADSDTSILVSFPAGLNATGLASGPVNVTLDAPSTSSFPKGTVTIANASSTGTVDLAVTNSQSSNTEFNVTVKVNEELAGALENSDGGLKIKLPSGFEWDNGASTATIASGSKIDPLYGSVAGNVYIKDDADTLHVYTATPTSGSNAAGFNLNLKYKVTDESLINKEGDVVANVTGTDNVNVTQLTLGSYGQFGGGVKVDNSQTLVSGQKDQKAGDITIKENIAGSFISGRTVELTLPDGARWESEYESGTTSNSVDANVSEQGVATSPSFSYVGTNHRTLRVTLGADTTGSDAGEIDLKNLKVAVAPDFTGDLNVAVAGSEGLTGTVKLATVNSAVTLASTTKPNVVIGAAGQALGNITLTENVAGALVKDSNANQVKLTLPEGVEWDGTPTVQVTAGDLNIDQSSVAVISGTNNNDTLAFNLKSGSATPSTVTITGAKLRVDRTVPQGDIAMKVKGASASYTANVVAGDYSDWNLNHTTAAKAIVATVVTPAANDTTGTAKFAAGSTTYTVNGEQKTIDVAPYTNADGRLMLPARFVANAVGVTDDNIIWNNATQTATIIKGDRVVAFTVGKASYQLNGVTVPMDTKAEMKAGRNMIPFRYLAQALGATVSWDDATQTATLN